jgi:RNA polymerase sigma-70 factor (ECF subfamily)
MTTRPLDAHDRRLADRMLAGEECAFEEFFDGHFPRLFRFAVARLGGNATVAEDVVQTTLCRAIDKLHTYRGEATLFTWLCTLCRHEISDYFRREGAGVQVALVEDTPDVRAVLDSLGATDPDHPERAARRGEIARLVHVVLDALPARYADVLEWKYLMDLPVSEIARRLDVGPKAAESMLTRARRAFRDGFASIAGGLAAGDVGAALH